MPIADNCCLKRYIVFITAIIGNCFTSPTGNSQLRSAGN